MLTDADEAAAPLFSPLHDSRHDSASYYSVCDNLKSISFQKKLLSGSFAYSRIW
jgi:hypothetical protein